MNQSMTSERKNNRLTEWINQWLMNEWMNVLTVWMNQSMASEWQNNWLTEWINQWLVNEWITGWQWMNNWLSEWINQRLINEWITGWLSEWINQWLMNERIIGWLSERLSDCLNGWLSEWHRMTDWLNDCRSDWLTSRLLGKIKLLAMRIYGYSVKIIVHWYLTPCRLVCTCRCSDSTWCINLLGTSFRHPG